MAVACAEAAVSGSLLFSPPISGGSPPEGSDIAGIVASSSPNPAVLSVVAVPAKASTGPSKYGSPFDSRHRIGPEDAPGVSLREGHRLKPDFERGNHGRLS
jgi:hypothetical protein